MNVNASGWDGKLWWQTLHLRILRKWMTVKGFVTKTTKEEQLYPFFFLDVEPSYCLLLFPGIHHFHSTGVSPDCSPGNSCSSSTACSARGSNPVWEPPLWGLHFSHITEFGRFIQKGSVSCSPPLQQRLHTPNFTIPFLSIFGIFFLRRGNSHFWSVEYRFPKCS